MGWSCHDFESKRSSASRAAARSAEVSTVGTGRSAFAKAGVAKWKARVAQRTVLEPGRALAAAPLAPRIGGPVRLRNQVLN